VLELTQTNHTYIPVREVEHTGQAPDLPQEEWNVTRAEVAAYWETLGMEDREYWVFNGITCFQRPCYNRFTITDMERYSNFEINIEGNIFNMYRWTRSTRVRFSSFSSILLLLCSCAQPDCCCLLLSFVRPGLSERTPSSTATNRAAKGTSFARCASQPSTCSPATLKRRSAGTPSTPPPLTEPRRSSQPLLVSE
jgi:hypothetical protein